MSAQFIARLILVAGLLFGGASGAGAQSFGTFRWQFAPYCNTVTLAVEQRGGTFRLDGYDDLCGGPVRAPASGTAQMNPNGTIGMGVTVIRADGIAVHHAIELAAGALTGSWSDNYGNSGTFAFNAPSPSPGAPRPVTMRGDWGANFTALAGTGFGSAQTSAISFGVTLASAPAAHFIAAGQLGSASCPGTAEAPTAAPGHLCVYESGRSTNQVFVCIMSAKNYATPALGCGLADTRGALILVEAGPLSNSQSWLTRSGGSWALTVP